MAHESSETLNVQMLHAGHIAVLHQTNFTRSVGFIHPHTLRCPSTLFDVKTLYKKHKEDIYLLT